LDWSDFHDDAVARAVCCRRADDGRDPPLRKQLFESVDKELKIYGQYEQCERLRPLLIGPDDLLFRSRQFYEMDSPSSKNRQSVASVIRNDN
jgi:hypothetical protein